MPEIRFYCMHCGHKLAVDLRGAGRQVRCPKCEYELTVPGSAFSDAVPRPPPEANKTHVIRIDPTQISSRSQFNLNAIGLSATTTIQILGWLFLALGVALHLFAPRMGWIYLPSYALAAAFGVTVMVRNVMTPGAILLGGGIIIPLFIYMFNMQLGTGLSDSSRTHAPVQTTRRLVFDEDAAETLIPSEATPSESRPARRLSDLAPIPIETESRPARRAERASGTARRRAPAGNEFPQGQNDPYAELLANKEEIPTLVPEGLSTNIFGDTALKIEGADDIHPGSSSYGEGWDVQPPDTSFVWQTPPTPEPVAEVVQESRPTIPLPFRLYTDSGKQAIFYVPSGMLGSKDATLHDESCRVDPHKGDTCIMASYTDERSGGGVAWQAPADNWGDVPGGYDLTGAKRLTFWAKKDEQVSEAYVTFKVGLESKAPYADTTSVSTEKLRLTSKWKKYTIPLEEQDLSRIITAFAWTVETQDVPVVFYLDDIQYE